MKLKVLLVEDDDLEAMKLDRAFSKLDFKHTVVRAKNGEEALVKSKECSLNLILLDLNMPRLNGLEFLSLLKSDEHQKFIPVVVFSTSNNHQDMIEAYKIGVAGYIVKPLHFSDYIEQIRKIIEYWAINEIVEK